MKRDWNWLAQSLTPSFLGPAFRSLPSGSGRSGMGARLSDRCPLSKQSGDQFVVVVAAMSEFERYPRIG